MLTHLNFPSPAINSAISSILTIGNGGKDIGFNAIDISFIGLSSTATRLNESSLTAMVDYSPFTILTHPYCYWLHYTDTINLLIKRS